MMSDDIFVVAVAVALERHCSLLLSLASVSVAIEIDIHLFLLGLLCCSSQRHALTASAGRQRILLVLHVAMQRPTVDDPKNENKASSFHFVYSLLISSSSNNSLSSSIKLYSMDTVGQASFSLRDQLQARCIAILAIVVFSCFLCNSVCLALVDLSTSTNNYCLQENNGAPSVSH